MRFCFISIFYILFCFASNAQTSKEIDLPVTFDLDSFEITAKQNVYFNNVVKYCNAQPEKVIYIDLFFIRDLREPEITTCKRNENISSYLKYSIKKKLILRIYELKWTVEEKNDVIEMVGGVAVRKKGPYLYGNMIVLKSKEKVWGKEIGLDKKLFRCTSGNVRKR